MKDKNDLMKELITAHKCSFSEYTNKHCIVTKNPSSNTGVNEGTVDITDDRNNPAPNQYYVENPSTDTNTNNDIENQNQHRNQRKKDLDKNTCSKLKMTIECQISRCHRQVMRYPQKRVYLF